MVVRLAAGGKVPLHTDVGSYFENYFRLHIPILTNPEVYFISQTSGLHEVMEAEKIYQLRNRKPHGVVNASNQQRIHLIVDAFSEKTELKYVNFSSIT